MHSTTARLALELGRDVLAVPGPVDRGGHAGCHRLLRDGATLCESADDVLAAMGLPASARRGGNAAPGLPFDPPLVRPPSCAAPPTGHARVVWDALDLDEAHDADDLSLRTGLSPDVVAAALTDLELDGRLIRVPGIGLLRAP